MSFDNTVINLNPYVVDVTLGEEVPSGNTLVKCFPILPITHIFTNIYNWKIHIDLVYRLTVIMLLLPCRILSGGIPILIVVATCFVLSGSGRCLSFWGPKSWPVWAETYLTEIWPSLSSSTWDTGTVQLSSFLLVGSFFCCLPWFFVTLVFAGTTAGEVTTGTNIWKKIEFMII